MAHPANNLLSTDDGIRQLQTVSTEFVELFHHGSLVVEYYKPDRIDKQQPHQRDEVYVITSGSGTFLYAGITRPVKPGDLLFVPAGIEHRFENFTEDLPPGFYFMALLGEKPTNSVVRYCQVLRLLTTFDYS